MFGEIEGRKRKGSVVSLLVASVNLLLWLSASGRSEIIEGARKDFALRRCFR